MIKHSSRITQHIITPHRITQQRITQHRNTSQNHTAQNHTAEDHTAQNHKLLGICHHSCSSSKLDLKGDNDCGRPASGGQPGCSRIMFFIKEQLYFQYPGGGIRIPGACTPAAPQLYPSCTPAARPRTPCTPAAH